MPHRLAALMIVAALAATGCSRADPEPAAARPDAGTPRAGTAAPVPPGDTAAPSPPPTSVPPAVPTAAPGTKAPEHDAFFDPPVPLPPGKPGEVIRRRPFDVPGAGTKGAAEEVLVMYTTTGTDGRPVAATGTVALPKGPAPAGGWPIVAWDHGTVGIGTMCAPSRGFLAGIGGFDIQAELIRRGFAVVQPDYIGMGVTGVKHPYLQGKPAAYATLDLVRAARTINPDLGQTWFVGGHSQGAHAALWTADHQPRYAPELPLGGVLAFAPGTGFQFMPGLVEQRDATAAPYIGIFLMLLDGAAAADPSVKPDQLLTPAALAVADAAWTDCLSTVIGGDLPDPADVLKPNADLGPLTASLEANATDQVTPAAPVFLAQGSADPLAPLNLPMAQALCAKGASIDYRTYPDQDHGLNDFQPSGTDALTWLQSRLDGKPPTHTCAF
ncbi:lipase family protein [Embleya sp. NPDC059213]|uniref:lipase family protein n=2 Tax=Embleya TaxID=2699295 RepID=UPI0036B184D1